MMKKIVSLILCVALCFTLGVAVFAEPATTGPVTTDPITTNPNPGPDDKGFKDVPEDYRAYKEIMYINGEGWMLGFKDNTFRPANTMTRAMLANVLYRMEKGDASEAPAVEFKDADTIHADYMDGVKYCVAEKLMLGYKDNTFRPDEPLTRAQFVTVLFRLENGTAPVLNPADKFDDVGEIAKDYIAAVNWAIDKGLIQGYDNNTFRPNAPLTRESFCVIMYRLYESPLTTNPVTPGPTTGSNPETTPVDPVTTPVA